MTRPRLILSACLCAALILGFLNAPGITLACILILGSLVVLVAGCFLVEAKATSREHDKEQNL